MCTNLLCCGYFPNKFYNVHKTTVGSIAFPITRSTQWAYGAVF